jgi:hypothetical protein
MRVAIFLLAISLFFSASAEAQGPAGVGGGGAGGGGGSRPKFSSTSQHDYDPWQIAIGYQYNRDNLLGAPFNTHGLNVSAARYFGRWFGVEAQFGTGFLGNTGQTTAPPNLSVKSFFVGVGPRLAFRNHSRYEPWIHVVVGLEHYRFAQTEADALGSRFFSTNQRAFQIVGGLVFGF